VYDAHKVRFVYQWGSRGVVRHETNQGRTCRIITGNQLFHDVSFRSLTARW
jgi:hypothetical protein